MNIYDALNKIYSSTNDRLSTYVFTDELESFLDTGKDKQAYRLLRNINSLTWVASDDVFSVPPTERFVGNRKFSIEDLTDDDYDLLKSLDLTIVPLELRARTADVLWTQKRDYKMSILAAESYFQLYTLWYSVDDWVDALEMIKQSLLLSSKIGNKELIDKYCKSLYDCLIEIDGTDPNYLSIAIIEILLSNSFGDTNKIIDILSKIIDSNPNDPAKIEHAYTLKSKYFNKMKKANLARQSNLDFANYLVDFAEGIMSKSKTNAFRVQDFYVKAIIVYRNNGEPQMAEQTHKRLVEIQKDIPSFMASIASKYDLSEILDNITLNMQGLSYKEAIYRLTQMVVFFKKDEYKQKVLHDLYSYPLSNYFPSAFINETGQTTFTLPGLSFANPEDNAELLDQHIHHKMFQFQDIHGNIYLSHALAYIRQNFDIENEDLNFLVDNNFIIPKGRKEIIRSGIIMALKGQYYEALHILAPQAESIFRNIAREMGGLTVTLESDGTSKEKVLSSIFDLPELVDAYDNDILFLFKGLLNEQAGANIRNEIAHGIMSPQAAKSGARIYFVSVFIKLIATSTLEYYKTVQKIGKLQSITKPEKVVIDKPTPNKT